MISITEIIDGQEREFESKNRPAFCQEPRLLKWFKAEELQLILRFLDGLEERDCFHALKVESFRAGELYDHSNRCVQPQFVRAVTIKLWYTDPEVEFEFEKYEATK